MSELLPCPFCGGEPKWLNHNDIGNFAIECSHCSIETPWLICKDTLSQLWNSRNPNKEIIQTDMKEIIIKMIIGRIASIDNEPLLDHENKFLCGLAKLIESTLEPHGASIEA